MPVKCLQDLCFETLLHLTVQFSNKILSSEGAWLYVFEIWEFISLLPWTKSCLYYKLLSKYAHSLSHDHKVKQNKAYDFQTLTTDEAFILLITCQTPKLVFDYKFKREKILTQSISNLIDTPLYANYLENRLTELDLSGVDFSSEDSLLIKLLPICCSLQVLCLGHASSSNILNAARKCPLKKLQVEERFPDQPKLSQDTLMRYIVGYQGDTHDLNLLIEICKSQTIAETIEVEKTHKILKEHIKCLDKFLHQCIPIWPNMRVLMLGNCKICREAVVLCLLILKFLEEISLHRIQSDEIINTCNKICNAFCLNPQLSIKYLTLWGGWAGFRTNALELVPKVKSLCLIAYGYSDLSLQETIEINPTLVNVINLSFVGLRHAGQSIFKDTNPFLSRVQNLEISGVTLSSEEFVNILQCLPNMIVLQLDYTELRCYNYRLSNEMKLRNNLLTNLSIYTSYIDLEFLKHVFILAKNIEHLKIRGRTVNFSLPFSHQQVFLNPVLCVKYLELYPQYPLDVPGLVTLARNRKDSEQIYLNIPLNNMTFHESCLLRSNGWTIIPACHRC